MSKVTYRDVDIKIEEAPRFEEGPMTVTRPAGGLIYKASSKFGKAFSAQPQKALDDARRNIDQNLDKK